MTWVIGANTMFGYGVVIADTCVSDGGKSLPIAVQKVFNVCRSVVAGYAGGIQNGFILIESLKQFLYEPDLSKAWDIKIAAQDWSPVAKWVFKNHKEYNRDPEMETHILLNAPHPNIDNGLPGRAKVGGVILKSPEFLPEFHSGIFDIYSIGSGSTVRKYQELIIEMSKDVVNISKMEMGQNNSGAYGMAIGALINDELNQHPENGINNHLHHFNVGRFEIKESIIECRKILQNGSSELIPKPQLAKSWEELKLMHRNISPLGSIDGLVG